LQNIIDGLEGLQRVLKKLRDKDETVASIVNGYHGIVLDNFECSDSLLTAVEVTAGKR
jgi:structural maintenance of chromosome 3 (chondroitin sulfate proteoglycan 6)